MIMFNYKCTGSLLGEQQYINKQTTTERMDSSPLYKQISGPLSLCRSERVYNAEIKFGALLSSQILETSLHMSM